MVRLDARVFFALLLVVVVAPGGDAHRRDPAADIARVAGPTVVRHRTTLPRILMRTQHQTGGGSQDDLIARLTTRGRVERWIEKASGAGGRWEPIDGQPAVRSTPGPGLDDTDNEGPAGTQAENSIAIDSTGQHIVIGMNDFRGFALNPASVSGYAYSDDGGLTFTDGGQLPITTPTTARFGQLWPQVFGDPDVKYLGGSTFVYFSLMLDTFGTAGLVQTLCFHRSTDYGHTWEGPFEIPVATNPSGLVDGGGFALDAADKELADVDPDTGRVIVSWSNFTPSAPGGVEISMAFSDNLATAATPTWAPRRVIASTAADGQAAIPRFAGNGSANAYIAWERYTGYYTRRIAFSRSTDNGTTWSAPVDLTNAFVGMDYVLGNDRVHEFPGLAVDTSPGPSRGNIYVVYANNNSLDGADISIRRSVDGGLTFSPAISVNSRPGNDRPQWFPYVTVDQTTGRVYVFYYSQDNSSSSGDVTEVSYQFSDDGGVTWRKPMPLSDRPFHAGYGNDTSQPNLGDYNQAVARGGELFVVWAGNPNIVAFTDGQPSTQFTVPDVFFKRAPAVKAALRLGNPVVTDSGGNGYIDAGEEIRLKLPLTNYAANPLFASTVSDIAATLSTPTPGIILTQDVSSYPAAAAGATTVNSADYVLRSTASFVPGTRIELVLTVSSSEGSTTLLHTLSTGTPGTTVLLSQNFDGVAPGVLPTGWSAVHGAGTNAVPWTTNATFNAGNNGAFHPNAADGGNGSPSRWERLYSPAFVVPANSDYVIVDFDTKYDTENDPNLRVLAYDGFFLRITDATTGRTLRSVLAEAFAEEFTTGSSAHYPRHLPRSGDPSYFEDMSVWAGDSQGLTHVHLKLPGMSGSRAQLRFEYTQDSNSTCADVRPGHVCGVLVDNVVVQSVVAVQADLSIEKTGPSTVLSGHDITYALVARNNGTDTGRNTATGVTVTDVIPAGGTFVSSSAPAGWSCSTPSPGAGGTFSCSKSTMAPGEAATFSLVVNIPCITADGTTIQNTASVAAASTADPDPANNSAFVTTTVSDPPPVISGVSATPAQLWPANHRLVDVTVDYAVSDNCGSVTTTLSVTSNEPVNGADDGDTSPDWIVVDPHHVQLRAERSGTGSGRTYTITIRAANNMGGTSSAVVTVSVPIVKPK
jgi:uncharacterized repeat protein (TIGR01451 family)